ncbi:phosphotransferase [Streptomyces acidicola]|uniref:phosphotransferase n=1 Tax=Streptomyces acidicola TaxID=2596892 RepID=UPI00380FE442
MTAPASGQVRHGDGDRFLLRQGIRTADEPARWTPLVGGVSSDLWKVDLPGRSICVKAALPTLRVADEWHAPVGRNAVEYDWLSFAGHHVPGSVPRLLGHDPQAGLFAMEYLPAHNHPVWKAELLEGRVDGTFADSVGDLLGRLHSASTRKPGTAAAFATDENFDALRIEPYLRVTARRNPVVAERLLELAERTAQVHRALVHGDVSPKNILIGPSGPVLLDAECAWFGDPAFDPAFCLTHLILKTLVRPERTAELLDSATRFLSSYLDRVDWEEPTAVDTRMAVLLPALLLARIDGASPVEYLTARSDKSAVRDFAIERVSSPETSTTAVLTHWAAARSTNR